MIVDISIIIPFYKNQSWLMECLNSITINKYTFEIILILDGNDIKVDLEELMITELNVKVFNINHSGPGGARNFGISRAVGNYLLFLDSDDLLENTYVDSIIDEMKINNLKWGHSVYKRFGGKDQIINNKYFYGDVRELIIMHCPISTSGSVVKRELFTDESLRFSEEVHVGEDTLLWIKLSKIESIHVFKNVGVLVRQHGDNARLNKKARYAFLISSAYLETITMLNSESIITKFWLNLITLLSHFEVHLWNKSILKLIVTSSIRIALVSLRLLSIIIFIIKINLRKLN